MRTTITILAALLIGALARDAISSTARADTPAAFDRAIVERLVRAEEAQARELGEIRRAVERCK